MEHGNGDRLSISTQTLHVFDPDQLTEAVGSSDLAHTQLSGGRFEGMLLAAEFGRFRLDAGRYNRSLISRGGFPPDRIVVGCLIDAKEAGCMNGYRFGRHDIVVFPEGAEMDYLLPGGTHWVAIQVAREDLENGLQARLPIRAMKVIPGNIEARFSFVAHLTALLAHIGNESAPGNTLSGRDCGQYETLLFDDVCRLLRAGWQDLDAGANHTRQMALLRRFEHLVETSPGGDLRIREMARRLGVSPRTLGHYCKDYLGLSPKQYLSCLRLNAVHRDLMQGRHGAATVESIARAHGVTHLGRFSAYYREQFGCNPSKTLNKCCS